MARLKASDRARLPDSAFAYVDSKGRRRLPIHDEAHVRNALARFERVAFEDDAARERARRRLLNAAKKYAIVPVGFITGQLESERRARTPKLPTGALTLLMTDIERSTALLRRLGDRYAGVLEEVRGMVRAAVLATGGHEVEARADEFFAVFERPAGAVEAAVAVQRSLGARSWPDDAQCRIRIGIHSGRPTLTETGYVGLSVHTAARVCFAAHGGQIVVTGRTRTGLGSRGLPGIRLRSLGRHRLAGLAGLQALYQVEAEGLGSTFPPLRAGSAAEAP
jgi:class 3 adenylate cyclase